MVDATQVGDRSLSGASGSGAFGGVAKTLEVLRDTCGLGDVPKLKNSRNLALKNESLQ